MKKYLLISLVIMGMFLIAGCTETTSGQCSDVEEPVCGTDGVTYSNSCFAEEAGVEVAHEGACGSAQGGCSDADGGKDIFLASGAESASGEYRGDYCKDSTTIIEYFCDSSGQISSTEFPCPAGYECLNGACSIAVCSDTDGGRVVETKGTATSGGETETDSCENDNTVKEYFCENGEIKSELIGCGSGTHCSDGACVADLCEDSDFGEDVYVLGVITKGGTTTSDSCYDADTVKEYYCSGDIVMSKNIACGSGEACSGGVCVEEDGCTDTDGGEDKYTVGTTSYQETTYVDGCYSDSTVVEYYCEGTDIKTKTLVCGIGYECVAGACVELQCEVEELDEGPTRYEIKSSSSATLYDGDLIEAEVGDTRYMLELVGITDNETVEFALYESYEEYLEGDEICDDDEVSLGQTSQEICGEDIDLDLEGIDEGEEWIEIRTGDTFNYVQYYSQEGTAYEGDEGCPADEIEETSYFYPSLSKEIEGDKVKILGENSKIDDLDYDDEILSLEFDGEDYELEDGDKIVLDDELDFEVTLKFTEFGTIYKMVVESD